MGDRPHGLQDADIEGFLGAAVAGTLGRVVAVRLLVGRGRFERRDLGFSEGEAVPGHLDFQRVQAFVNVLQTLTLPHAVHARWQ